MSEAPLVTPINPKTLDPNTPSPRIRKPEPVEKSPYRYYIWFLLILIAGIGTGFLISKKGSPTSPGTNTPVTGQMVNTKNEIGSTDTKTFRDTATGTLEIGSSNGEGTHKLIRPGGPSQTVYLVSSIIDLDQYAGKKVEIWGETLQAKKVGWLMDVGRLKIIE